MFESAVLLTHYDNIPPFMLHIVYNNDDDKGNRKSREIQPGSGCC